MQPYYEMRHGGAEDHKTPYQNTANTLFLKVEKEPNAEDLRVRKLKNPMQMGLKVRKLKKPNADVKISDSARTKKRKKPLYKGRKICNQI